MTMMTYTPTTIHVTLHYIFVCAAPSFFARSCETVSFSQRCTE